MLRTEISDPFSIVEMLAALTTSALGLQLNVMPSTPSAAVAACRMPSAMMVVDDKVNGTRVARSLNSLIR